jgi:antirestriction protein ArdC
MARNIYQEITDKIVAMLEAGTGQFEQPWANLSKGVLPRNIASGKGYRGVNVLSLWAANSPSTWWGTYQQWLAIGAQVRKGEKSSTVVYYQPATKRKAKGATPDAPEETFLLMKYYSVFHLGQVDAIANEDGTPGTIMLPAQSVPTTQAERIEAAEAFFQAIPGELRHGGDRAFYNPDKDYIGMPLFQQFGEAPSYYSTLAHEYVHWSGHKLRLDRAFGKRFGDEAYAMEELVAELGAAFVMGMSELSAEPRRDHAQYLASWLKVLKADARAIFTVASKAQAAAEYLAGLAAPVTETELEELAEEVRLAA